MKFCEKAEGDLEQAKRAALEQTVDIAELMRTIDHIREQLRAKRLTLQATVKDKKELIKAGILANAKQAFADHVAVLEKEIAPLRLVFQARDFAGAMKNKRTLATLQDAVDTELANGKIAVDAIAQAVRGRLAWYREHAADHEFLFADLQAIIQKPDEDFQMVVRTRIDNHKRIEDQKAEQARQAAAAQVDATPAAAEPAPAPAPAAQVTRIAAARPAAASSTPPTLRLGQISDRLGFPLTGEFLGKLGFAPAATDKSARLYHERDFPAICAALIDHINAVSQAQQAA